MHGVNLDLLAGFAVGDAEADRAARAERRHLAEHPPDRERLADVIVDDDAARRARQNELDVVDETLRAAERLQRRKQIRPTNRVVRLHKVEEQHRQRLMRSRRIRRRSEHLGDSVEDAARRRAVGRRHKRPLLVVDDDVERRPVGRGIARRPGDFTWNDHESMVACKFLFLE